MIDVDLLIERVNHSIQVRFWKIKISIGPKGESIPNPFMYPSFDRACREENLTSEKQISCTETLPVGSFVGLNLYCCK